MARNNSNARRRVQPKGSRPAARIPVSRGSGQAYLDSLRLVEAVGRHATAERDAIVRELLAADQLGEVLGSLAITCAQAIRAVPESERWLERKLRDAESAVAARQATSEDGASDDVVTR